MKDRIICSCKYYNGAVFFACVCVVVRSSVVALRIIFCVKRWLVC